MVTRNWEGGGEGRLTRGSTGFLGQSNYSASYFLKIVANVIAETHRTCNTE